MQHFGFTQAEAAPDLVGLPDLAALAREGWAALLLSVLCGAALALSWLAFATTPDWRAEARVQLAADLAGGTSDRAISTGTEVERLRSAALLRDVIGRLGHDRDPAFAMGPRSRLGRLIGGAGRPPDALADHAVARLESQSAVQAVPGTTVARIAVHADSAAGAAAIAQAYAESYVSWRNAGIDADDAAAQAGLARLAAETEDARVALARFHAGPDPGGNAGAGLAVVDRELRSSRARLDRARNAMRGGDGGASGMAELRRQTRQERALADGTAALAPQLAEQDRLGQALADATARLDRAREAWLRRETTLQRAAILSDARQPLDPVAVPMPLIAALGAAGGGLAALAGLLWRQHRRGAPRRAAAALGLRLIAVRARRPDPARRRADGGRIAAALPPGPLDLAVLPATPAQSRAATALAADIAAALSMQRETQLILCDTPAEAASLLAPAAFGTRRPAVVHLGAAMLATRLSAQSRADGERTHVTLAPPATDWRGPAVAARAAQALIVVDAATPAPHLRELRLTLREAGLRLSGVVVLGRSS